jgi:aldehyde dehydrogenase (NAD+)
VQSCGEDPLRLRVPFGGYKMSGRGRESVEEYLNLKAVWIKTA